MRGLDQGIMEATYPGERWSITGLLQHIGGAEWWYLDRLGLAFDREVVSAEPFERLDRIRELLIKTLPELEASTQVAGIDGQFWSPRKVLRRALWLNEITPHTSRNCWDPETVESGQPY